MYLNIETNAPERYTDVRSFLFNHALRPFDFDYWNVTSSWRPRQKYDQDNGVRLYPIITARNMAIDYALHRQADWLFFVDSDVIVPPDSLTKLLALGRPLVGGLVPGRGAHSHVNYVFGQWDATDEVLITKHGTMGCCLIHKDLFQFIRFRQGPHPIRKEVWLSEDPCYAADAEYAGRANAWYIHTGVVCGHIDNPDHPLTGDGAINDYEVTQ
jgi:glycosyltransferase involved in cell wall biosynthesis